MIIHITHFSKYNQSMQNACSKHSTVIAYITLEPKVIFKYNQLMQKKIQSGIQIQSITVECLYIPMSKHSTLIGYISGNSAQKYSIWDILIQPITVECLCTRYVKAFYSDWLCQDKKSIAKYNQSVKKKQYRKNAFIYLCASILH